MQGMNAIRFGHIVRRAQGYLELDMPEHALTALDRAELPGHRGLGQSAVNSLALHGSSRDRSRGSLESVPISDRVRLLYLRGEALRSMSRYHEALLPLHRAAVLDSDDIHVHLAIAWCQKRLGRIDLAVEALDAALRADPTDPLLLYNQACYHSLLGHREEALDYLSEALAIDPDYRFMIEDEPDFDPLRGDPEFQDLTSIVV